jgi:glycogen debranching enzyme
MSIDVGQSSLIPISMEEAVGHRLDQCAVQISNENTVVLTNDRYFLITDQHGNITAPCQQSPLGLFYDDTRFLSHYELKVRSGPPSLLSVQVSHSYGGQFDLAITDADFGGDSWDPKNCVHIQRQVLLSDSMIERVTLSNYLPKAIDYWLELSLAADFADIFEVRGWKRDRPGQYYEPQANHSSIRFPYRGADNALIETIIKFHEPPTEIHAKGARWKMDLPPKGHFQVEWEIQTKQGNNGARVWSGYGVEELHRTMENSYREWSSECTQYTTNQNEFELVVNQAIDDLRALYLREQNGEIISAGIPWYAAPFGRDACITSIQTLSLNPKIAVDTLKFLARYQGKREDPFTEEQPGKIMHELRRGELARGGEIPHIPYYGTIDATPLWLILLHDTWQWTGDLQLVRELMPNAERALHWMEKYGDIDGDGFLEYAGSTKKGLKNQGWKDSGDGVPFPDATLPEPPIALVEVQGYAYDALKRTAELYLALGEEKRFKTLCDQAASLREKIIQHFWIESVGTFALALDGEKQIVPTITSNAGHLLWSGVPAAEQAGRVVKHLLNGDMFSGWGIRTLSAAHRVYNPMSYHNGSVWPHDNSLITMGLANYGFSRASLPLIRGMYDAAIHADSQRLPELFCGMPRTQAPHPVWYPVSCSPQAWASGAMFLFLHAVLGIRAEAPARILHVKNPVLPDFLDELTISNLAVGGTKVSLQFKKHHDRTLANLLSTSGDPIQVRIELT